MKARITYNGKEIEVDCTPVELKELLETKEDSVCVPEQKAVAKVQRTGACCVHRRWSKSDCRALKKLVAGGVSVQKIAAALGRTFHAVRVKISKMQFKNRKNDGRVVFLAKVNSQAAELMKNGMTRKNAYVEAVRMLREAKV